MGRQNHVWYTCKCRGTEIQKLPQLALLVEGRTEEGQVGRLLRAPLEGVLYSSESSLTPDWIRALAANRLVLRMHIL